MHVADVLVVEFTMLRAVPAEGARVGIVSCLVCGAALTLDPEDTVDVRQLHREWHEGLARG